MATSLNALKQPQYMTVGLLKTIQELSEHTENPLEIPEYLLSSHQWPFVEPNMYNLQPIKTYLYSPNVWSFLDFKNESCKKGLKPVFDTKCKAWTALKVKPYLLCTQPEGCDGVVYLYHGVKKDRKKPCDVEINFKYYPRFFGFLRIYETKDDHYMLEGLLADGQGNTQTLYRITVPYNDSNEFIMRFMEFEKRIIIWTKDQSVFAKKNPETGEVEPEIVILEFPTDDIYNLVVAILHPRSPRDYCQFISKVQNSPNYDVEQKDSRKSIFPLPKFFHDGKLETALESTDSDKLNKRFTVDADVWNKLDQTNGNLNDEFVVDADVWNKLDQMHVEDKPRVTKARIRKEDRRPLILRFIELA